MKLAFLSDVHSAAAPFSAALKAARQEGFDQLIILGDLLTYGPEPERSVDLARDAVERDRATLIMGNHDALYLEPDGYDRPLPDWIRESVEWTRSRVAPEAMAALPWQQQRQVGDLLIAHANPFGGGDWSYLRTNEDLAKASQALVAAGFHAGVFGHVHRFAERQDHAAVYTVGSLGQPRSGRDLRPQWAMGELKPGRFRLEPRPFHHDWSEHCAALRNTGMSASTVDQLCRFFI
ncbi:metallophosphoesterase family protein [Sphingomonas arenae]|uniref:metallophosphoesterase family protein n=1 Tax=Sphingomonas arenae TaxID=2812555 RepID=UPI0019684E62|nr:metallophosphoesterase family protein [Sphingomonas arenae]